MGGFHFENTPALSFKRTEIEESKGIKRKRSDVRVYGANNKLILPGGKTAGTAEGRNAYTSHWLTILGVAVEVTDEANTGKRARKKMRNKLQQYDGLVRQWANVKDASADDGNGLSSSRRFLITSTSSGWSMKGGWSLARKSNNCEKRPAKDFLNQPHGDEKKVRTRPLARILDGSRQAAQGSKAERIGRQNRR